MEVKLPFAGEPGVRRRFFRPVSSRSGSKAKSGDRDRHGRSEIGDGIAFGAESHLGKEMKTAHFSPIRALVSREWGHKDSPPLFRSNSIGDLNLAQS